MKKTLLLVAIALFIFTGCQHNASESKDTKAKYIFLFIGDGMGIQQVNTTQVYLDSVLKNNQRISFIDFPVQTFATTYAANRYITCSAAAGTALSTGCKTSIGTIAMNYNHTDSLFSVAKALKEDGFKIGIMTSVGIDDATPSVFYAHQGSRGSRYDIAKDLLISGYDLFISGGFLDPYGKKLKEPVQSIYTLGKKHSVAFTKTLLGIDSLRGKCKTIVYETPKPASESSFRYSIDQDSTDITLAALTKKAIQTLDNPKGFFMMVEGGKIDWACHANDAGSAIDEVIDFSNAVAQAVDFYNSHPDETVIIVTADHETGGFSLGNKDTKYDIKLSLLKNQKISKEAFQEIVKEYFSRTPKPTLQMMLNLAKEKIGIGNADLDLKLSEKELKLLTDAYNSSIKLGKDAKEKANYMSESKETFSSICIEILNRRAAIGWTSTSHTGTPVPVYVLGKGSILFTGRLDNTDIPKKIRQISGVE